MESLTSWLAKDFEDFAAAKQMTVKIFIWGRRSQSGAARIVVLEREAGRNVRKIESSDLHPSTSRQATD